MSKEEIFMRKAISLAEKGRGTVSPNPMVGALVVKAGEIMSEGYHIAYGRGHAEVQALNGLSKKVKGVDLYITLEPCGHYGKTPPCLDLIKQYDFKNIFIGSKDPNPLMNGKSISRLRRSGYKVTTGVLSSDIKKQNESYFYYHKHKKPFVTMKAAVTLDGKIATKKGDSKWITSAASRKIAHKLRSENDAVMVGIGTILADDPLLTARGLKNGSNRRQPVRVIIDTNLRMPLGGKIVKTAKKHQTIIACSNSANTTKAKKLEKEGIELMRVPTKSKKVSLAQVMKILAAKNITSVLIEGGSSINGSALNAGIINKMILIYAPKVIGGDMISVVGGNGAKMLKDAKNLKISSVAYLNPDVMIEAYV